MHSIAVGIVGGSLLVADLELPTMREAEALATPCHPASTTLNIILHCLTLTESAEVKSWQAAPLAYSLRRCTIISISVAQVQHFLAGRDAAIPRALAMSIACIIRMRISRCGLSCCARACARACLLGLPRRRDRNRTSQANRLHGCKQTSRARAMFGAPLHASVGHLDDRNQPFSFLGSPAFLSQGLQWGLQWALPQPTLHFVPKWKPIVIRPAVGCDGSQ
jgi:hypothetical protein